MEITRSIGAFVEVVGEAAREDWLARRLCLPSLAVAIAIEGTDWGRSPEAVLRKELYPGRKDCEKRSYQTWQDSVLSHNAYLASWKSPDQLQPNWECLTGETNYIRAVQYLQRAQYPYQGSRYYETKLISLIEGYELYEFDCTYQEPIFAICTERGLGERQETRFVPFLLRRSKRKKRSKSTLQLIQSREDNLGKCP